MTEPICSCDPKKYPAWGIADDKSLFIACGQCNTKVSVPYDKLVASFLYDQITAANTPTPKKEEEIQLTPKLFGSVRLFDNHIKKEPEKKN